MQRVIILAALGLAIVLGGCAASSTADANEPWWRVECGDDVNMRLKGQYGRTPLLYAASISNTAMVWELLAAGARVDVVDDFGKDALTLISDASSYSASVEVLPRVSVGLTPLFMHEYARRVEAGFSGMTPLMRAAVDGSAFDIAELVESGADVNAEDVRGWTALFWATAADEDVAECIKELCRLGADVDHRDAQGRTALHMTTMLVRGKAMAALLERGASVDVADQYGATPLMYGGWIPSIVTTLLAHGADVNGKGPSGATALMLAGNVDGAKALLEGGADINAVDDHGRTALDYAALYQDADRVRFFAARGLSVNNTSVSYSFPAFNGPPLRLALERRYGPSGWENRDFEFVKLLVELGADPNARCIGESPLALACKRGDVAVVELLLEHGGDPNAPHDDWASPLGEACEEGRIDVVKLLLKHGADPNVQADSYGTTPLMMAVNRPECVELLLEAGADMNKRETMHGDTAAASAASGGYMKTIDVFLAHGWPLNGAVGDSGGTLLHAAVDSPETAARLIAMGADVNAQDSTGKTPLFWAIGATSTDSLSLLLDAGADLLIRDSKGQTPLDFAKALPEGWHLREEIITLLREHGAEE